MLDIEKQFPGVKALDHARLQLRPGSIHALMGENGAGKSTLMKCLFGIYKKDAGSIRMNGKEVNFVNPRHALDNGVAMVHQELNQVLYRSVMENMWLGRFPLKGGLVDHKKMYNDTKAVLDDLEIKVDPKTIIGTMAVSQRQMLEIAKAVSYNAKILVLDEPTSSLTAAEVEALFTIVNELRAKGDQVSLEEIERNVRERDKADMGRAISPLRQAEDAIVLDNSCMTVGEQMAWFMKEFEQVTR